MIKDLTRERSEPGFTLRGEFFAVAVGVLEPLDFTRRRKFLEDSVRHLLGEKMVQHHVRKRLRSDVSLTMSMGQTLQGFGRKEKRIQIFREIPHRI